MLCIGGGGSAPGFIARSQIRNSGDSGTFSLAVDLTSMPTPTGGVAATPGERWYFQAWYRDANPAPTSAFSDAVELTLD